MKKLWQKDWQLDSAVEAFETGDDLLLDQKLVWADVAGSLAHAHQLCDMGILTKKEWKHLKQGLHEILSLWEKGEFILTMGDEDVHTKIEQYLTVHCGDVGKKIHTGRSRNDQVATALRLYMKWELGEVWSHTLALTDAFLSYAIQFESLAMSGYTHMQKAMPSSVGMWAVSCVASLCDDLTTIKAAYALIDQSPLGSAAGYGVPLALNREQTAMLLGFDRVQTPSLYCQNSRGKTEAAVVAALVSVLQTINKFTTDALLFTTSEFGFFTVDDTLVSGSSIMPQKKNIDIAELLRSKVHVVAGRYHMLVGISSNLPSGYNRDLQDTKKPVMESLQVTKSSLVMSAMLLAHLKPNKQKLQAAMTPELYAAHRALALVAKGVSFRDAYQSIDATLQGQALQAQKTMSSLQGVPLQTVALENLGFSLWKKRLQKERTICHNAHSQFTTAVCRLGVDLVSTGRKDGETYE